MLDEMLLLFKNLVAEKPNSIFLFISGDDPNHILNKANDLLISTDSIRVQSAKHNEVSSYISLFTASVFFIRPTYSKKASSPTKQGELMAMGIPIICNSGVGDTDKIVKKYHAGIVIEKLEEDDFVKINWDKIPFEKELSQRGAQEFYGLENGVKNYFNVYRKLLQ
jgi:hypothetical protein